MILSILAMSVSLVVFKVFNKRIYLFIGSFIAGFMLYSSSIYLLERCVKEYDSHLMQCLSRLSIIPWVSMIWICNYSKLKKYLYLKAGFNKSILKYVVISVLIILLSFLPFIDWKNMNLFWTSVFSSINAPLEEILWRGLIFSGFKKYLGTRTSMVWSGLLFGSSHAMLGFSLLICIVFALGGFLFDYLAKSSKGITMPVIVHWVTNFCFGISGLILK